MAILLISQKGSFSTWAYKAANFFEYLASFFMTSLMSEVRFALSCLYFYLSYESPVQFFELQKCKWVFKVRSEPDSSPKLNCSCKQARKLLFYKTLPSISSFSAYIFFWSTTF